MSLVTGKTKRKARKTAPERPWTFLSNYGHVLMCLAANSNARLRDVAMDVGITERAAIRLVKHLAEAGIVTKHRVGRRNRYEIHIDESLRHPLEEHRTVGSLLALLKPADSGNRGSGNQQQV